MQEHAQPYAQSEPSPISIPADTLLANAETLAINRTGRLTADQLRQLGETIGPTRWLLYPLGMALLVVIFIFGLAAGVFGSALHLDFDMVAGLYGLLLRLAYVVSAEPLTEVELVARSSTPPLLVGALAPMETFASQSEQAARLVLLQLLMKSLRFHRVDLYANQRGHRSLGQFAKRTAVIPVSPRLLIRRMPRIVDFRVISIEGAVARTDIDGVAASRSFYTKRYTMWITGQPQPCAIPLRAGRAFPPDRRYRFFIHAATRDILSAVPLDTQSA